MDPSGFTPEMVTEIANWALGLGKVFALYGWFGLLPPLVFGLVTAYKSPAVEMIMRRFGWERYTFSNLPAAGKAIVIFVAAAATAIGAKVAMGLGLGAAIVSGIVAGLMAVAGHKLLPEVDKREEAAARIAAVSPAVAKPLSLIVKFDPALVEKIKAAKSAHMPK